MSAQTMIGELVAGNEKNFYVITIREGWDNQDIQNYLETNHFASASDFVQAEQQAAEQYDFFNENVPRTSLEGYIFPDTYYVYKTDTADQLITKALSNLHEKITRKCSLISTMKVRLSMILSLWLQSLKKK